MADVDVVSDRGKGRRGKKTSFEALGIPVGSELVFKNRPEVKCVTVDAVNQVERDGERFSISSLASSINGYPSSGYGYFTWNGVLLSKLRDESVSGGSPAPQKEPPTAWTSGPQPDLGVPDPEDPLYKELDQGDQGVPDPDTPSVSVDPVPQEDESVPPEVVVEGEAPSKEEDPFNI
jgi:hypothetical protein